MEKLGKRLIWVVSFLALISVLGCSLKIDIDPGKLNKKGTSQSEGAKK